MQKLEFSELQEGMRVQDTHKNISTIKKCKDIHNVLVQFEKLGTGGYGYYCLDEKDLTHYDPLYKLQ
jgi:hypothetical protein